MAGRVDDPPTCIEFGRSRSTRIAVLAGVRRPEPCCRARGEGRIDTRRKAMESRSMTIAALSLLPSFVIARVPKARARYSERRAGELAVPTVGNAPLPYCGIASTTIGSFTGFPICVAFFAFSTTKYFSPWRVLNSRVVPPATERTFETFLPRLL